MKNFIGLNRFLNLIAFLVFSNFVVNAQNSEIKKSTENTLQKNFFDISYNYLTGEQNSTNHLFSGNGYVINFTRIIWKEHYYLTAGYGQTDAKLDPSSSSNRATYWIDNQAIIRRYFIGAGYAFFIDEKLTVLTDASYMNTKHNGIQGGIYDPIQEEYDVIEYGENIDSTIQLRGKLLYHFHKNLYAAGSLDYGIMMGSKRTLWLNLGLGFSI